MKRDLSHLEKWAVAGGRPIDYGGAYVIDNPHGRLRLKVIASWGDPELVGNELWDHVSVSLPDRCPTWDEMAFIASLFFEDEECVVQYRPPKSQYRNVHPFCLHLWRPQTQAVPMPPLVFV